MSFDPLRPWRSLYGSPMPKAWDALLAANQAVVVMKLARDIQTIEDAWNRTLADLDIVWNQAGAALKDRGPSEAIKGWYGKQNAVRTSDPLLVYIDMARNNQTHNPTPSIERRRASEAIMIRAATPGGSVYVKRIAPGLDGSPFGPGGTFDVPEGVSTVFRTPATIKPLPATNHGKTYPVPTTHLGGSLPGQDFVHLAEPALAWYQKLLHELETRLNGGNRPQWMVLAEQYERARRQNAERILAEQAGLKRK